jgi:membrane-associated phospholipid phosphatase
MHYDPVGAIPSEHVADPVVFFLFLRRQFGRWAYLSLLYIAGILFSITYMGQHYVIDAIVGAVYASAGYVVVMHAAPAALSWIRRGRRRREPALMRNPEPDGA